MRRISAITLFLVLLLTACRPDRERAAMAQVPDVATAPDATAGRLVEAPEPRRLWVSTNVDLYEAAISPDGRFVTEGDDTGNMAVRDLATGDLHRLTGKRPEDNSIDYFASARFSPDGRHILYSWYDEDTADSEIRLLRFSIGRDGSPVGSDDRLVYPGGVPEAATGVYGWVSSDEALIELRRPDQTLVLAVLTLADGSTRPLKSFGWDEYPSGAVVSPDGRYIAYDQPVESGSPERAIRVLAIDGSADSPLVVASGRDRPLAWLPDGSALLFHRWTAGDGSIWRIPVSEGRSAGRAEEVLGNVPDPTPIGFAGEAFHYGLVVERPSVVTARIDADAGRILPLQTRFAPPTGGRTRTFAWTPDGRHVLEEIDHPGESDTWIRLRTRDGEPVEDWTFDLWIMFTHFRFAPDGRSVLVPARDARERPGFIRIDLDGGEASMLVQFDRGGEFGRVFDFSPDGERLYFTRREFVDGSRDEAGTHVVERVLATGAERRLAPVRDHGAVSVSPDGEWLAVAFWATSGPKMIRAVPVKGGQPHTVYESDTEVSRYPTLLGWSEDGGSFLFLDRLPSDDDVNTGVFRVSLDGAEAERLATIEGYRGLASLHPDGRTLAYRTGEQRGEIWALEGLDGADTAASENGRNP